MTKAQETLKMFDALITGVGPRRESAETDDAWYFWEGYLAALHDLRLAISKLT